MKEFGQCMVCKCKLPIEELERLAWNDGHKGIKGSIHHKLICKDCSGETKKSEFGRCVACDRCLPLDNLTEIRWSTRSKHLNKLQDRLICQSCIEKAEEPFDFRKNYITRLEKMKASEYKENVFSEKGDKSGK